MSYSRWLTSAWYTYWCASEATDRDGQLFDVCSVATFTYRELKDDIDACIQRIVDKSAKSYTHKEYEELKGYMKEFIEDVESDPRYNTPSQQYKDGKITLEEAFVEEV